MGLPEPGDAAIRCLSSSKYGVAMCAGNRCRVSIAAFLSPWAFRRTAGAANQWSDDCGLAYMPRTLSFAHGLAGCM